ncbi:gualylate cyclase [Haladaptatus sp. R4]|nr:gualylate cyclase [Haladaptatus sp. R4]
MDVHRGVEGTAEDVARAHEQDIETQEEHGVEYKTYWAGEDEGVVFCLFEAPNKEAGEKVHREAHGLVADEIFEVEEGE